jgi:hypothetical protein
MLDAGLVTVDRLGLGRARRWTEHYFIIVMIDERDVRCDDANLPARVTGPDRGVDCGLTEGLHNAGEVMFLLDASRRLM